MPRKISAKPPENNARRAQKNSGGPTQEEEAPNRPMAVIRFVSRPLFFASCLLAKATMGNGPRTTD